MDKHRLAVLLFEDFELLDVCGPLEFLGLLTDRLDIDLIAENTGPVKAFQGMQLVANTSINNNILYDIILVPGGIGTRQEVDNSAIIQWIQNQANASYITSVCTGAALLAKAGLLEDKRATSNKLAFDWVTSQSNRVDWRFKARWVKDDNIFTSAGVSAGIDMSLALVSEIWGEDKANELANFAEYYWNRDPSHDAFAERLLV